MGGRTRRTLALPGIVVLILVAAACTGGDEDGGGATGAEAAGASTTFTVVLTEFAIDPGLIHAPAGQTLTFRARNDGTAPHTFAVDTGEGVIQTREPADGAPAPRAAPARQAGEYKVYSPVPGQVEAGMIGSLVVD